MYNLWLLHCAQVWSSCVFRPQCVGDLGQGVWDTYELEVQVVEELQFNCICRRITFMIVFII